MGLKLRWSSAYGHNWDAGGLGCRKSWLLLVWPHSQITHSFCLPCFLLPVFVFFFPRTNVSYWPFCIRISQTWLLPPWVLGYVHHFHILYLGPGLARQASQGWGNKSVTSSVSWNMNSPFTHSLNSPPLPISNPKPCSYWTLRKFFWEMIITQPIPVGSWFCSVSTNEFYFPKEKIFI